MLDIIRTTLISRYYDNLLAKHFRTKETRESVTQKYYWLTLMADIES